MGRLIYMLSFLVFSDELDFQMLQVNTTDNFFYEKILDYDLDIDLKIVKENKEEVKLITEKETIVQKSQNRPMFFKITVAIDLKEKILLIPSKIDKRAVEISNLNAGPVSSYLFENGYNLLIERDFQKNLKIYKTDKSTYKISYIHVIDHRLIDENLNWWYLY